MSFQTRVNSDLPIGIEGDFADANPIASQFAGEAALVAGPGGITVGRFAWLMADGRRLTSFAQGGREPDCFIHRDAQALLTGYMQEAGTIIPQGFGVTGMVAGNFLMRIPEGIAYKGTVYASFTDGTAHATMPAGDTATGSIGATFTATGADAGSVHQLTVSAVTGLISVGDTVAGANIPAGTVILSQVSGTPGGAGVYAVSNATTINNATATCFGTTLNVTAVNGVINLGQPIAGTNIPANATVESQQSGATGGAGVYTLDQPATQYVASGALTLAGGIALTKWKAQRACGPNELTSVGTWN